MHFELQKYTKNLILVIFYPKKLPFCEKIVNFVG